MNNHDDTYRHFEYLRSKNISWLYSVNKDVLIWNIFFNSHFVSTCYQKNYIRVCFEI